MSSLSDYYKANQLGEFSSVVLTGDPLYASAGTDNGRTASLCRKSVFYSAVTLNFKASFIETLNPHAEPSRRTRVNGQTDRRTRAGGPEGDQKTLCLSSPIAGG